MAYDNLTSRSDAGALVPEEVSKEMLGKAVEDSAVLKLFKRVPVARNQVRFPILSALPVAYWVNGDTGLKQTSELGWTNKYLNIEEMAVIVPFPDNVVADVDANLWDEAEPLIREAFGRTLDTAVFFGLNAPSSFPTNILSGTIAATGNMVTEGTAASAGGFFGDIDKLYAAVEADGFEVEGFVARTSAKSKLRTARDTQGRKLDEARTSGDLRTLDGYPVEYVMNGLWPELGGSYASGNGVRLFAGDWDEFVIGVRQDITIKVLDQAVIQDNTGAIVYNLAQQDMTAVRVTFRVGWQVSNRINNENTNASTRYPVAALQYAS
jgi:HK97 family phage major capsid protein